MKATVKRVTVVSAKPWIAITVGLQWGYSANTVRIHCNGIELTCIADWASPQLLLPSSRPYPKQAVNSMLSTPQWAVSFVLLVVA